MYRSHRQTRRGQGSVAHGRAAFTLIEMLVVMVIIMILIGLLISGLRGAREAARTTMCLPNHKQISLAQSLYASEWKDHVPREGTAPNATNIRARVSWAVAIRPYLDDRVPMDGDIDDEIPDDLFAVAPYYLDPGRTRDGHRINYVVNAFPFIERGVVDLTARNDYRFRRGPTPMTRLRFPQDTLFLSELCDDANGSLLSITNSLGPTDLERSQLYDVWDPLHVQQGSSQMRIGPTRHGGYGNGSFLDGHAATMRAGVLMHLDTWDDRDYGSRSGN